MMCTISLSLSLSLSLSIYIYIYIMYVYLRRERERDITSHPALPRRGEKALGQLLVAFSGGCAL